MASEAHVPKLLTVAEVAERLGMEKWGTYELLKRGQGPPHLRIGRRIRVSEEALARWIEQESKEKHTEEE